MKPHWPTPPQNLRPTPPQMPHRPLFQLLGVSAPLHSAHILPGWKKSMPFCLPDPAYPVILGISCHFSPWQGYRHDDVQSDENMVWHADSALQNPLSLCKSKLRLPCRRKSTWCKLSCRCANSTLLHQVATTSGANGPRSTPGHTDRALLQIFISIPSFLYFTMWTPFSIERIRAPSLSTWNLHSWVIFPVLRATFFGGNILTITCSQWTCEKSALLIWSNH